MKAKKNASQSSPYAHTHSCMYVVTHMHVFFFLRVVIHKPVARATLKLFRKCRTAEPCRGGARQKIAVGSRDLPLQRSYTQF